MDTARQKKGEEFATENQSGESACRQGSAIPPRHECRGLPRSRMSNDSGQNQAGVKIEVHVIQNFAPSNLNRDDTNQPKNATFGGFRRARISSQCEKRAIREWWREHNTVPLGNRTKRLQQVLFDALQEDLSFLKDEQDTGFLEEGIRVFTDAYYADADKKKPMQTSVLIFVGPDEVQVCVKAIRDFWNDMERITEKEVGKGKNKEKKEVKEFLKGIASVVQERRKHQEKKKENDSESEEADQNNNEKKKQPNLSTITEIIDKINKAHVSADIALFGRMLAEQPGRNTDGACQVAHPISTHKVDMEMDFFTAVDDLNPAEETGAGMMGVIGFNSSCFYRYALVDRDLLARNLARKAERKDGKWTADLTKDDYKEADKVIEAFLEAMVYAIPTGKQNSFAARNLPSFGMFVRRQGGVPISLANAFAQPVRPSRADDDLIGLSVSALTKHWEETNNVYTNQGDKVIACFHLGYKDRLNSLRDYDKGSVAQAITEVMKREPEKKGESEAK